MGLYIKGLISEGSRKEIQGIAELLHYIEKLDVQGVTGCSKVS